MEDLRSDGSRLDLRSHVLFVSDYADSSLSSRARTFWASEMLHENAHWKRLHGSSIGLLLTSLQRARLLTATSALRSVRGEDRIRLLSRRKSQPIWSFESGFEPELIGEPFALSGQFYLDLKYAYRAIFDTQLIESIPWYSEAISCAMADAWNFASTSPGSLPFPGNATAERFLISPEAGWKLPQIARQLPDASGDITYTLEFSERDQHLSTRLLLECASVLDELVSALGTCDPLFDNDPDLIRMITFNLDKSEYGFPWRLANTMCGVAGTTAPLFLVAIDIAINPPLPWIDTVASIEWRKFFPPARFVTAYEVIGRLTHLHERIFSDAEILDVRRVICEESSLIYGGTNDEYRPERLDLVGSMASDPYVGFLEAISGISRTLMKDRFDRPASLIFPKLWSSSEPVPGREFDRHLCETPWIWDAMDGMHHAVGLSRTAVLDYLRSCITGNLVDQFVSGVGAYDMSFVPTELRRVKARDHDWPV